MSVYSSSNRLANRMIDGEATAMFDARDLAESASVIDGRTTL